MYFALVFNFMSPKWTRTNKGVISYLTQNCKIAKSQQTLGFLVTLKKTWKMWESKECQACRIFDKNGPNETRHIHQYVVFQQNKRETEGFFPYNILFYHVFDTNHEKIALYIYIYIYNIYIYMYIYIYICIYISTIQPQNY